MEEHREKKRKWASRHDDNSVQLTSYKIKGDSTYESDRSYVFEHQRNKSDQEHTREIKEDSNYRPDGTMTNNRRIVEIIVGKEKSRVKRTNSDVREGPAPIVGYTDEPTLSLLEACTPLTDTIHNLSFYAQMALGETPKKPPDGLTVDESAAIRLYTMEWEKPHRSLYFMLNRALLKGDRELLRPYFNYLKLFLTALVKLPCVPHSIIWKGVTKNLSAQFSTGSQVTWWSFASCTTELATLKNNTYLNNGGDRTLFSVEANNGRAIRAHSHYATEDEILLLPGTQMIVQSQISPEADLHIIHLKQIIPEEILLEPPFRGNLNTFNHL